MADDLTSLSTDEIISRLESKKAGIKQKKPMAENTSFSAQIFPYTSKAETKTGKAAGVIADLFSLPGRAIATGAPGVAGPTGAPGPMPEEGKALFEEGRQRAETLGKTRGENIVEDILRNPGTGAATALAPVTGGMSFLPALATGTGASIAAEQAGRYAEEGKVNPKEIRNEVILTGLLATLGPLGKYAQRKAPETLNRIFKPSMAIRKTKYKPEQIFEKGLGGNLEKMAIKADRLWNETNKKFGKVLKKHKDKSVNAFQAWAEGVKDLEDDIIRGTISDPQVKAATRNAYKEWLQSIDELSGGTGIISIKQAQELKKNLGNAGKFDPGVPKSELTGKVQVADELYFRMDDHINKIAPELKSLNKELSELRPINRAIADAAFRMGKTNLVQFSDLFAIPGLVASPTAQSGKVAAALTAGSRISKSPSFANFLFNLGESTAPGGLLRVPAAATRRVISSQNPDDARLKAIERADYGGL